MIEQSENILSNRYIRYRTLLQQLNYSTNDDGISYSYELFHSDSQKIKELLKIGQHETSNDFDKALYIMRKLHKLLITSGNAGCPDVRNGLQMLENRNIQRLNCRGHAIVLNDILLAYGYKSKFICCMSDDPADPECHVTNQVYIKKFHKWIMLDSALQAYVEGDGGIPLGLEEVRKNIINGVKLKFMISPSVPNDNLIRDNFENYLIKNMYCFLSYEHYGLCCDNKDNNNSKILLLPVNDNTSWSKGYKKIKNVRISNCLNSFFE